MKRLPFAVLTSLATAAGALAAVPATAAAPRTTLSVVPHAASHSGGSTRVDVYADSARGFAGYEMVATVDGRAATLDGADSRSVSTTKAGFLDLSMSELHDQAVLAAYSPSGSVLSGHVRLGSIYVDAKGRGDVRLRVGAVRFVNPDGSAQAISPATLDVALSSGRGLEDHATPAARWQLPGAAPAGARRQVLLPDPELELAWQTARLAGSPCADTAASGDRTGDGCLDVGDLVVNGRTSGGPLPATQSTASDVAAAAVPGSFVVDSTSDEWDLNVGNGVCRTASGVCSLRAAIQEANASSGANEIDFAIPGSGVHTIQLTRQLPALTDTTGGTFINGYSQPGSSPNTDPRADNAAITVEVRGNGATSFDALPILSSYNTLRGLAMYNSRRELWIYRAGATHNTVAGNFIGTDATATFVTPAVELNAFGIHIEQDAADNVIGGTAAADRNVVSGNGRQGVALWHNQTDRTVIVNNLVGLGPDGTRRVPNRLHGIDLNFGASQTQVGGTAPGERNVVSGNDGSGIEVSHTTLTTDNVIKGNYIGTDVTGNAASAATANSTAGIYVEDAASANVFAQNVIANNVRGGLVIVNGGSNGVSTGNVVRDNRIGVGSAGAALGNSTFGVLADGAQNIIGPGNTIRFNAGPGVKVEQTDTTGNKITENVIADNQGLSIDLSPVGQVNPNDPDDSDTGPNTRLNYPEPLTASDGRLTGRACAGCTVEIFATGTPDGNGPARSYVASIVADGSGDFGYDTSLPVGTSLSAVAIDPSGNTSEMAPNVTMRASNAAPTVDAGPDVTVREGESATLTATVSDPDGTTDTVAWDLDGDGSFETSGNPVTFSTANLAAPATVTVTAKVTDPGGLTATDSLTVTVEAAPASNAPPTARMVVPSEVLAGQPVPVALDQPNDSASDLSAGLTYAFDCGGGYGPWGSATTTTCPSGAGPTKLLRAKVQDQHGAVTEYPATVVVYQNLLGNGGFESGTTSPASWTWGAGRQWVTSPVAEGRRAVASLSTGTSTPVMSQSYTGLQNSRYVLSGQVNVPASGSGSLTLRVRWYDSSNTLLSTLTIGTLSSPTNGWTTLSKSFPARAGATKATVELAWNTNGRAIAVDDMVLRRDNGVLNGEFDLDANGDTFPDSWYPQSRFTQSSEKAHLSSSSGKASGDGGGFTPAQSVPYVVPGGKYVVTAWINVPANSDTYKLTVRVRWRNTANSTISLPVVGTVSGSTPGWTQVSATLTAPAGVASANLEFNFTSGFRSRAYLDSVVMAAP